MVNHEATGDSPSWTPPIAAPARLLLFQNGWLVEKYSAKCLVTKLTSNLSAGTERLVRFQVQPRLDGTALRTGSSLQRFDVPTLATSS